MKIFDTVDQLRMHLGNKREGVLGFVPTMGALHQGHLSLVGESRKRSDTTLVSIFVNPTQFNDPADLKKYPRDIRKDISLLSGILAEDDILFTPDYNDLYSREKDFSLDLEGLDLVMEGKYRPGHFSGVVRVVKLLFETVEPDLAFFGQKDFQQLAIIKKMVKVLNMDTKIIGCPILREENGLAMSSRNERLDPQTRKKAGIIYSALSKYCKVKSPAELQQTEINIIKEIEQGGDFRVEYLEVVDSESLNRITSSSVINTGLNFFACIAVYAGDVRLIDNTEFSFQFIKG